MIKRVLKGGNYPVGSSRIEKRAPKSWLNKIINEALDNYTAANPKSGKSAKTTSEWYNTLFGRIE